MLPVMTSYTVCPNWTGNTSFVLNEWPIPAVLLRPFNWLCCHWQKSAAEQWNPCARNHRIDRSRTKPSQTSHFSWRNDNISIYKPFTHQHLDEIRQSLSKLQNSFSAPINFIPVRGNFSRGIFASLYLDCPVEIELLKDLYNSYYDDHNFTFLTDKMPDLKQVVNTNKCLLYLEKHDNKLLIVSVIDNLLKGASGQAVHNMNLLFGLHERVGLHLKPSAFNKRYETFRRISPVRYRNKIGERLLYLRYRREWISRPLRWSCRHFHRTLAPLLYKQNHRTGTKTYILLQLGQKQSPTAIGR